ncbi:hypothetical protein D9757_010883 [Collybiopsis confluens]|uniref:Eukaryotic translation initiation factor 2D-like PUA RNA-binding domain-containing protein n=1 Tax=Collybiopsis confluens TaxID=2823264 RepID=A0A8H5H7X8_9AGAR|nr:hypothetical protein D9757_010883 [Collybiopsis confluens]
METAEAALDAANGSSLSGSAALRNHSLLVQRYELANPSNPSNPSKIIDRVKQSTSHTAPFCNVQAPNMPLLACIAYAILQALYAQDKGHDSIDSKRLSFVLPEADVEKLLGHLLLRTTFRSPQVVDPDTFRVQSDWEQRRMGESMEHGRECETVDFEVCIVSSFELREMCFTMLEDLSTCALAMMQQVQSSTGFDTKGIGPMGGVITRAILLVVGLPRGGSVNRNRGPSVFTTRDGLVDSRSTFPTGLVGVGNFHYLLCRERTFSVTSKNMTISTGANTPEFGTAFSSHPLNPVLLGFTRYTTIHPSPLWFTTRGSEEIVPTIYTLFKHADLLPFSESFLTVSADLMIPGVVYASPNLAQSQLVAIRQYEHADPPMLSPPLAVGRMALSSERLKESNQGKAVLVIHVWKDHLWEMGPFGVEVPPSIPLNHRPQVDEQEAQEPGSAVQQGQTGSTSEQALVVTTTAEPPQQIYTPDEISHLLFISLIQTISQPVLLSSFPIPASLFFVFPVLFDSAMKEGMGLEIVDGGSGRTGAGGDGGAGGGVHTR